MNINRLLLLCIGMLAAHDGVCRTKQNKDVIRVEETRPVTRVKKRVYRDAYPYYPYYSYPYYPYYPYPYSYYAYPWGGPYYGPGFGFYIGF